MNRLIAQKAIDLANRLVRSVLALQTLARERGASPEVLEQFSRGGLQIYTYLRQMQTAFEQGQWQKVWNLSRAILTIYQNMYRYAIGPNVLFATAVAAEQAMNAAGIESPQDFWRGLQSLAPRFSLALGLLLAGGAGLALWAVFKAKRAGKKAALLTAETAGYNVSEYEDEE